MLVGEPRERGGRWVREGKEVGVGGWVGGKPREWEGGRMGGCKCIICHSVWEMMKISYSCCFR